MRQKGWKLDPAWLAHYAEVDRQRRERAMYRLAQRSNFDAAHLKLNRRLERAVQDRPMLWAVY